MHAALREEIEGLLDQAWVAGRCLTLPHGEKDALRRAMSRAVAEGWCVSPVRGAYAPVEAWGDLKPDEAHLRLARSVQDLHPGWVFCGPTAAVAYGLDVSWSSLRRLHVAVGRNAFRRGTAAATFHPILDACEVTQAAGGLSATTLERAVLDCLRWTSFSLGMGVADSALRVTGLPAEELRERVVELGRGLWGLDRVRSVLAHADARAESGGESIARARMLQLGFVCPELQVCVPPATRDATEYRVDYLWARSDGVVIVGELDGAQKRIDPQMTKGKDMERVLMEERMRESRLTLYDVAVMRFGFGDTEDPRTFTALLDSFGVPKRGSRLALPEGMPMEVDWPSLLRH